MLLNKHQRKDEHTSVGDEALRRGGVRQHLSEREHGLQHVLVVRLAQAQQRHQRRAAARRRQRRGRARRPAQRARQHHALERQLGVAAAF